MKVQNHILATVICGLIILCLSCTTQTEAQKNVNQSSNQNVNTAEAQTSNNDSAVKNEVDTSKWRTYKDTKNGYSFRYPPNLILQKKGGKVRLYHFINFKHQDPCDMRNGPPFLNKLIDFDVTFEVVNKNVDRAIDDLPLSDYPQSAAWKLAGTIEGKSIRQTIELCGNDAYIFPFKTNKSLVITDEIISLFSGFDGTSEQVAKALRHPSVIKPEMSAKIVENIFSSFKSIEN